jgi:hypothetical protein
LLKELTVLTRDGKFDQEFPLDSFEGGKGVNTRRFFRLVQ